MKVFVWREIECVTQAYHPNGGAVVVAESLERAHQLLAPMRADSFHEASHRWRLNKLEPIPEPDLVLDTSDTAEHVMVFENTGCC